MLTGQRKPGRCQPCLDLFALAMTAVYQKRAQVVGAQRPAAYAARITLRWLKEYLIQRRADAHGICKPDVLVGVPLRIYQHHGNDWYALLLSLLLADAAEVGAVPDGRWRYDALCERRSRDLGIVRTFALDDQVRFDVAEVLRIAHEVAGPAWVHKYLDAPIERRRAENTPLRLGNAAYQVAIEPVQPGRPRPDILADELRSRFFTELATRSPVEAIHAATASLVPDRGKPRARAVRECNAYIVQLLTELVCQRVGSTADGALRTVLRPAEIRALVADQVGHAAASKLNQSLLARVSEWTERLAKPPADRQQPG
jgi:hypothetical protein